MRLKFLFFPIMLGISVYIFAFYMWPEIKKLNIAKEQYALKNDKLKELGDKSSAIQKLGKELSLGTGIENDVNNYLPKKESEERIIGGINYLAGDAGVSLINVGITSKGEVETLAGNKITDENTAIVNSLDIKKEAGFLPKVNSTRTTISLAGEYSKIKIFLDGLQRMPLLNSIVSVDISKNEGKDVKEELKSMLSANIVVDFGYLPVEKVSALQLEKFNSSLDSEVITSLKKYISQKSNFVPVAANAGGKENPFFVD